MRIGAAEVVAGRPDRRRRLPLSLMTRVIATTTSYDWAYLRRGGREPAPMTQHSPRPLDVSHAVATITLNRPDAMNGLDVATKDLL